MTFQLIPSEVGSRKQYGYIMRNEAQKLDAWALRAQAATGELVPRVPFGIEEKFQRAGKQLAEDFLNATMEYVNPLTTASLSLQQQIEARVKDAGSHGEATDIIGMVTAGAITLTDDREELSKRYDRLHIEALAAAVDPLNVVQEPDKQMSLLSSMAPAAVEFSAAWVHAHLPNLLRTASLWTFDVGQNQTSGTSRGEQDAMKLLHRVRVFQRAYYLTARACAAVGARWVLTLLTWPFLEAGLASVARPVDIAETLDGLKKLASEPVPSIMRFSAGAVNLSTCASVDSPSTEVLNIDVRALPLIAEMSTPSRTWGHYRRIAERIWFRADTIAAWVRMLEAYQGSQLTTMDAAITTALELTSTIEPIHSKALFSELSITYYDGWRTSTALRGPWELAMHAVMPKRTFEASGSPHIGDTRFWVDISLEQFLADCGPRPKLTMRRQIREYIMQGRARTHFSHFRPVNGAQSEFYGDSESMMYPNTAEAIAAYMAIDVRELANKFKEDQSTAIRPVTVGLFDKGVWRPSGTMAFVSPRTRDAALFLLEAPEFILARSFTPYTTDEHGWFAEQRIVGTALRNREEPITASELVP